jgi:hypothetical protein
MKALEIYAIAAPAVAFVLMGAFGFVLFRRDVANFKLSAARNSASVAPAVEGQPVQATLADQPDDATTAVSAAAASASTAATGVVETSATALLRPEPASERGNAPSAPTASFDAVWPKPERARAPDAPLPGRSGRTSSTSAEAGTRPDRDPPAAPSEDQPPVTVLKSGVVDGMAYSLYSDGSIEAQMPEGMLRFASIDELRSHLDERS